MAPAFLLGFLPVAVPFLLTIAVILSVGEAWPRNIAPGSGLKLWGLFASGLTAASVWLMVRRRVADQRAVRFAALFCVMTGLLGWPAWSVGVLPSINGRSLDPEMTQSMVIERLEITAASRQRGFYYWAWLTPLDPASGLATGRYVIPEDTFRRWSGEQPKLVQLHHARGALGARVVTGYR